MNYAQTVLHDEYKETSKNRNKSGFPNTRQLQFLNGIQKPGSVSGSWMVFIKK